MGKTLASLFLVAALTPSAHALQYIVQSTVDVTYTPTFLTGTAVNTPSPSFLGDIYDQNNSTLYLTSKGGLSAAGYNGIRGQYAHCDEFLSLGDGASSSGGRAYAPGYVTVLNSQSFALSVGYSGSMLWTLDLQKNGVGAVEGSYSVVLTADPYYLNTTTGIEMHALAQPIVKTLTGAFDFAGTSHLQGTIPFSFSFSVPPNGSRMEFLNARLDIVHSAAPVPEPAPLAALGIGALSLLRRRRALFTPRPRFRPLS